VVKNETTSEKGESMKLKLWRTLLLAVCLFGMATPISAAAAGGGTQGYRLSGGPQVAIGQNLRLRLQTPRSSSAILFFSLGSGPTDTAVGQFCLDFPPLLALGVALHPIEDVQVFCPVACDPNLVGMTAFVQFFSISLDRSEQGISNPVTVTVVDGPCN
jgi:hypothetical protein